MSVCPSCGCWQLIASGLLRAGPDQSKFLVGLGRLLQCWTSAGAVSGAAAFALPCSRAAAFTGCVTKAAIPALPFSAGQARPRAPHDSPSLQLDVQK